MVGGGDTIILIGLIDRKGDFIITIIHRDDFRNRQHTAGNCAIQHILRSIIADFVAIDINTRDAGQCIHIMERSIHSVIIEIQARNTLINHVSDITRAVDIFPTSLIHVTSRGFNIVTIGLSRNQTVNLMVIFMDFDVDISIAGITTNIHCCDTRFSRHLTVQIHTRQLDVIRLAVIRTNSHVGANFHKNLVRDKNPVTGRIEIDSTATLCINAGAICSRSIAFHNGTKDIQLAVLSNKNSAGSIGTDSLIAGDFGVILQIHTTTGSHMNSGTAIIHIGYSQLSVGHRDQRKRHVSVLHIENAAFIVQTILPGQAHLLKLHRRTIADSNGRRTSAQVFITTIGNRIIVTLHCNVLYGIIRKGQSLGDFNVTLQGDNEICLPCIPCSFDSMRNRQERMLFRTVTCRIAATATGICNTIRHSTQFGAAVSSKGRSRHHTDNHHEHQKERHESLHFLHVNVSSFFRW